MRAKEKEGKELAIVDSGGNIDLGYRLPPDREQMSKTCEAEESPK